MKFLIKYSPYILLLIAVTSLVLQYMAYEAATADCDCHKKQVDSGTGNIV